MKILIISDVHAMSKEIHALGGYSGGSGSILNAEERSARANPVIGISGALKDYPEQIDLMLCLGDLTHQAKQLPLLVTWRDLHDLSVILKIPAFIGVVGNHDIMSRADTPGDVETLKEFLQSMSPSFPSEDEEFNTHYFAYGVASTELNDCLLVALDTCRAHGLGFSTETTQKIFEAGTLTNPMIEKTINAVTESQCNHVIVAMHHHPMKVRELDDENEAHIENGDDFLTALQSTGKNILVLHGHKHLVEVKLANDAPNAPVVFSSSSLCAYPYTAQQTDFSNQFHIIEFDTSISENACGTIYSWDRGAQSWHKSKRSHMPFEVPFGITPNLDQVAAEIIALENVTFSDRETLISNIPVLKYIKISQIDELNDMLKDTGKKLIKNSGTISGLIYEEIR